MIRMRERNGENISLNVEGPPPFIIFLLNMDLYNGELTVKVKLISEDSNIFSFSPLV